MKSGRAILLCVFLFHFTLQMGISKPDARREGSAIACAQGMSEKIPMRSTDRLRQASGAVTVERKGGTTEVEVELDAMKPASLFGGDYNTYALWVVPPQGPAENLGSWASCNARQICRAILVACCTLRLPLFAAPIIDDCLPKLSLLCLSLCDT